MKIGFIGVGKLGKEAAEVMAEKHDIVGYDVSNIEPENFKMVASIEEACKGREIIFIAVPTPHHPDYDGRYPTAHLPNKDFNYNIFLTLKIKIAYHFEINVSANVAFKRDLWSLMMGGF